MEKKNKKGLLPIHKFKCFSHFFLGQRLGIAASCFDPCPALSIGFNGLMNKKK